ncbi:MAG: pilus assembly protein [Rhizobiaceae bacterium]|nr:pilus assembly protein [Rhizobiaceae bacterium]
MSHKFLSNIEGNIAVTSALLIVPIMLSIGSAVDYTGYSRKQSQLKNAVDAAILSIGNDALQKTNGELTVDAKEFLKANLAPEDYNAISSVALQVLDDRTRFRLVADSSYDTAFMRIAGYNQLDYQVASTINLSGGDFEVVMVLDSTNSMSLDGKMGALKSAANDFVDDLSVFNANQPRVKMGVVPFSDYVNVGTSQRGASWLNVPADTSENICQMVTPVISRSGCTTQTYYNDGVPYTAETCTNVEYGPAEEQCGTVKSTWHGCVGSRPNPLNIEDRSYGTRVPGIQNISCGTQLTSLTTSASQLKSAINSLTPNRNTYIPAGLTWGLRVLSPQTPFTGGASHSNTDVSKVLILMSDGENVASISSSEPSKHDGSDANAANQVTLDLCDEIKDLEITVYTIGFGSAIPTATQQMLEQCSTDGTNYYAAADAQQLSGAFDAIAKEITALYLSE